ncbi:hypothetical protein QBC34DRAFT_132516 [Podospora aff. communis PSN243]|uniref:Uncharacterized protein n=1 Tax=Podospora aff. communis PSN243 TaxID=3040156 RepID=A0AAV9GI71_9PEZI|nr:hypothetical protein QBC34DRAFT_132516 [Podospora aff. communis PSN243]
MTDSPTPKRRRTKRQQPAPIAKTGLNYLENIPTEIQIMILKEVHIGNGRKDLASTIQASPTLFQTFASAKTMILIAPAVSDLGLVLRDAIAAIQARDLTSQSLYNVSNLERENFIATFKEDTARLAKLNESYRKDLTLAASGPVDYSVLTRGIDTPNMVVSVLRLNEATQHIVNIYEQSRFLNDGIAARVEAHCTNILPAPPSADDIDAYQSCIEPFTLSERRRLAQAFIRRERQLELFIPRTKQYWERYSSIGNEVKSELNQVQLDTALCALGCSPFQPWELEQMSQAHDFIIAACRHLMLNIRSGGARAIAKFVAGKFQKHHTLSRVGIEDLSAIILTSPATAPRVFSAVVRKLPMSIGTNHVAERLKIREKNGWPWQWSTYDDSYNLFCPGTVRYGLSEAGRMESQRQPRFLSRISTFETTPTRPPFGWADALDVSAPGDLEPDISLLRKWWFHMQFSVGHMRFQEKSIAHSVRPQQRGRIDIEVWKWWGFVFWDERRVKGLKLLMRGYDTAWFTQYPAA